MFNKQRITEGNFNNLNTFDLSTSILIWIYIGCHLLLKYTSIYKHVYFICIFHMYISHVYFARIFILLTASVYYWYDYIKYWTPHSIITTCIDYYFTFDITKPTFLNVKCYTDVIVFYA